MSCPASRIDFYSAADGARLATHVWDNNCAPPKSRVVFLHGISSHGGWYHRSCEHLAAAGHEVHFLDRRGSGLNGEQRGDVDCWHTWISDVATYLERLPKDCPVALCGISWGGKLATAVARLHPGLIHGLGLICPGLYSHYDAAFWKRCMLAAPLPAKFVAKRVRIPLQQAWLFTDNPPQREFVARDPLALREVTLRFAQADRQLSQFTREAAPYLHTSLLLMLAGRDRIVDNRRTRKFFTRTAVAHRVLVEYPNAAHTLEFEPDPLAYFGDLTSWVERLVVSS